MNFADKAMAEDYICAPGTGRRAGRRGGPAGAGGGRRRAGAQQRRRQQDRQGEGGQGPGERGRVGRPGGPSALRAGGHPPSAPDAGGGGTRSMTTDPLLEAINPVRRRKNRPGSSRLPGLPWTSVVGVVTGRSQCPTRGSAGNGRPSAATPAPIVYKVYQVAHVEDYEHG